MLGRAARKDNPVVPAFYFRSVVWGKNETVNYPFFSSRDLSRLSDADFGRYALLLYQMQARFNAVYRRYLDGIGRLNHPPARWQDIPLLPIRFFKTHQVLTTPTYETYFMSSGTTQGADRSYHFIASLAFYHSVARAAFERAMGPIDQYYFIGLLPSYLDNPHSSLISMVGHFMEASGQGDRPLLRTDYAAVTEAIRRGQAAGRRVVLFGTPYALDEWVKEGVGAIPDWIIETGGSKGRGREWVKEELHDYLRAHFPSARVITEYGMAELLSQAYSRPERSTWLQPPPWMRVVAIDPYDPLAVLPPGRRGRLGVIDLANQHSAAFIATDDLGETAEDGTFRILGRMEGSDVRGCNLLLAG